MAVTGSGAPPEDADRLRFGFTVRGDPTHVRAYDSMPIDSLWAGGHVASRNPSPEAMVVLCRLSALTERVQIGTSILLLPLYPPAIVAKQVADLDRASGGRVILGVGVGGEYPQEFRACGVPIAERGPRTNEAIPLLRRLWSAEPITHDGPYYPMEDVKIHPSPLQAGGPPIVVAGRKEPAMRRAATLGDGWMPYLYSPRRYAASVASIKEFAAETGRDLRGFQWFVYLFVNVGADGRRARDDAAAAIGGNYNQDFSQIVDSTGAAGTTSEVVDKVRAFVEAGARHFIFAPATVAHDYDAMLRRVLDEVVSEVGADRPAASPAP